MIKGQVKSYLISFRSDPEHELLRFLESTRAKGVPMRTHIKSILYQWRELEMPSEQEKGEK